MNKATITTTGGVGVTVHSRGDGPGLVILHGGGVGLREYERLAAALSDRFTVHLYNRRGRPGAAPLDRGYSIATDLEDLAAVLNHTGAGNLLGHSGGGFVALRAATEPAADPDRRVRPGTGDLRPTVVCVPGRLHGGDRAGRLSARAVGDDARGLSRWRRREAPGGSADDSPPGCSSGHRSVGGWPTCCRRCRPRSARSPPTTDQRRTTQGSPPRCCWPRAPAARGTSPRTAQPWLRRYRAVGRSSCLGCPTTPPTSPGRDFVGRFGDFFAGAARPVAT